MIAEHVYFIYDPMMSSRPEPSKKASPDTLSVELGNWFKAHATGAGVIAIPIIVLVLGALALLQRKLG